MGSIVSGVREEETRRAAAIPTVVAPAKGAEGGQPGIADDDANPRLERCHRAITRLPPIPGRASVVETEPEARVPEQYRPRQKPHDVPRRKEIRARPRRVGAERPPQTAS